MLEKFRLVETDRTHAEDKTLKIATWLEGQNGLHGYDTEIPELEAHQMAAVEAVRWAGVENFDLVGYAETAKGLYTFVFRELKP